MANAKAGTLPAAFHSGSQIMATSLPTKVRWLFILYATCFVGAGLNHAHDLWLGGWLPYMPAPLPMNVYWSLLTVLDPLTAALLFWRPRAGMVLAVLIMISDVAVNSYGKYGLGYGGLVGDASLQLQTLFLGFVVGTVPFAWARLADSRGNPL